MSIDLYDWEIQKVATVYGKLTAMAKATPNTRSGITELGRRIQDEFFKAGFIATVDMSACVLLNPNTGRSFSPEVEIIARVDDPRNAKEFDHDEKRFEVVDSRSKGEKYRGDAQRVNIPRRSP